MKNRPSVILLSLFGIAIKNNLILHDGRAARTIPKIRRALLISEAGQDDGHHIADGWWAEFGKMMRSDRVPTWLDGDGIGTVHPHTQFAIEPVFGGRLDPGSGRVTLSELPAPREPPPRGPRHVP